MRDAAKEGLPERQLQWQPLPDVLALLCILLWLGWLAFFPWQLTSDDALNFAHAVVRFSVIEESPHFPGYPGFVWLTRLAAGLGLSPVSAIVATSWLGSGMIAWYGYLLCRSRAAWYGLPVLVVLLFHPLLPTLALSGLTDAPAIACLLAACHSAECQRPRRQALWLAIMLAIRPSFAVLAIGLWSYSGWQSSRRRRWLLETLLLTAMIGAGCGWFIWMHDGVAYLNEGVRFTQGHYELWGNTPVSHPWQGLVQWWQLLAAQLTPVGVILLCWLVLQPLCQRQGWSFTPLWVCLLVSLLWLLTSQNPENSRHAALPVILSVILFGRSAVWWRTGLLQVAALALICVGWQAPSPPAISTALTYAAQHCHTLVTQYGVKLAQQQFQLQVIDAWYQASARLALTQGACRLSSEPLAGSEVFRGRFAAEKDYYLLLPRN